MKTLIQHLDEYLEYAQSLGQSPVHLRVFRFNVLRLISWLAKNHSVKSADQLSRRHLDEWVRAIDQRRTAKGLPLKKTSVSKQHEADRVYLRWLEKVGAVPSGFSTVPPRIKLPELLPTSVLTHNQMVGFLDPLDTSSPEGSQMRTMLEVLYSTGLRASELLSLDVDSIDLTARTARVIGKGAKERIVVFGKTAQRLLENHLKGIRPLLLADPSAKAIWLNQWGAQMQYHTFRLRLVELVKHVRLPVGVTAHTFRRSFATEMVRADANLWILALAMGHANIEALKPYIKTNILDLKRTLNKCHPREKDRRQP